MTDSEGNSAFEQPRLRRSLDLVRAAVEGMTEAELLPLNVDPINVATTVRGTLPHLLALRDELSAAIGSFDVKQLDQLDLYASALLQAHAEVQGTVSRSALPQLGLEARELHDRLLADVKGLARRGLIAQARLAGLKTPNGHRNIASNLATLASLLRDCWPELENRSPIPENEIDQAEVLVDKLVFAIGSAGNTTVAMDQATALRHRVFTKLVKMYDEVRRAVAYLRWHEADAEEIAPSIYRKRRRARAKLRYRVKGVVVERSLVNATKAPEADGTESQPPPSTDELASNVVAFRERRVSHRAKGRPHPVVFPKE